MKQQLCVLGHHHSQLVAGISLLEALCQIPGVEVAKASCEPIYLMTISAQLDGGDALIGVGAEFQAVASPQPSAETAVLESIKPACAGLIDPIR